MRRNIFSIFVSLLALTACSPNLEEKADALLQEATALYESEQYNAAKLYIDSLHQTYPRLVKQRRQAKDLMYKIEYKEAERTLVYCDSLLSIQQPLWEKAAKAFVLSDTNYIKTKTYTHKTFAKANPHTSLQCEVNEKGEVSLISIYRGKALDHTSLKVNRGDLFASTDTVPTENAYNNRFNDLGVRWEYVTFEPAKAGTVAGFIANYSDKTLKVTLSGNRLYRYFIPVEERKAFETSVNFAIQTQELYTLQQTARKAKNKKLWLEEKSGSSPQLP